MSTYSEVRDHANEIAKELRTARIKVDPYQRGPIATEIASLSVTPNGGALRIWPGVADVDIATDRKHRQAVLHVKEGAREITRTYDMRDRPRLMAFNRNPEPTPQEVLNRNARDAFPVFVPKSKFKAVTIGDLDERQWRRSVTATIVAPATKQTFLVGIDETSHFIAPLKKRATSVEAAHKLLRPAGVPQGTLRQGEWFFVPVTATELRAIDAKLRHQYRNNWSGLYSYRVRPLEPDSTHIAPTLEIDNRLYASGLVVDQRRGRHVPLVLDGWHRVVRNAEITNPAAQQMRRSFSYD